MSPTKFLSTTPLSPDSASRVLYPQGTTRNYWKLMTILTSSYNKNTRLLRTVEMPGEPRPAGFSHISCPAVNTTTIHGTRNYLENSDGLTCSANNPAQLLRPVATPGWSGPYTFSSIASEHLCSSSASSYLPYNVTKMWQWIVLALPWNDKLKKEQSISGRRNKRLTTTTRLLTIPNPKSTKIFLMALTCFSNKDARYSSATKSRAP